MMAKLGGALLSQVVKDDSTSVEGVTQHQWKTVEGVTQHHWKTDKTAFNINFEYLERLLFGESHDTSSSDVERLSDSAPHDADHPPFKSSPPPGHSRILLHSSSTHSIFHASTFRELGGISGQELEKSFLPNEQDDAWWLDILNPSEADLRLLCAAFNIHPLTAEDIWRRELSEKIEEYPSYRFACFRSFHEDLEDDEIVYKPYTIYMIVFSQGTLTFCFGESNHSLNVEKRVTRFEELVSVKSDWIFYAFVDDIVDSFDPSIARIEKMVAQIEDQVYTVRRDDQKEFLRQIESIRKRVLGLIRLLNGKDKVLRGFENHHHTTMSSDKDILLYINDVQDHIAAMLSNLNQFEGLLSRSKTNYLSQLEAGSLTDKIRTFKYLSRISVLSLIVTFVTLTSNVFGTNVDKESGLYAEGNLGRFFGIIGGELFVAIFIFYLAKRYEIWW